MYSFCSRSFFLSKGNSLGLKELFRMQLPFCIYLFSASCLCRARVPKAHTPHFHSLFLLGLVLASFARPVSALSQKALIQGRNGWVLFLALCSVSHGTAVFFTSLNVPSLAYLMVCTCSAEPCLFLTDTEMRMQYTHSFSIWSCHSDPPWKRVSWEGVCTEGWSVSLPCIPESELRG